MREKVVAYDAVFDEESTQTDVYERVGQEILGSLIAGYNSCVLCYGHTGAGKTHTMYGYNIEDEAQMGLAPRLVRIYRLVETLSPTLFLYPYRKQKTPEPILISIQIKSAFRATKDTSVFESAVVKITFLQIYNNEIWDLLAEDCGV